MFISAVLMLAALPWLVSNYPTQDGPNTHVFMVADGVADLRACAKILQTFDDHVAEGALSGVRAAVATAMSHRSGWSV